MADVARAEFVRASGPRKSRREKQNKKNDVGEGCEEVFGFYVEC